MEVDEVHLLSWREVQRHIASQIIIPKQSLSQILNIHGLGNHDGEHGRYKYVLPSTNINNRDGRDGALLVGGVDVSFPDNETEEAIAVYVILQYNNQNENHAPNRISPSFRVVYRSHKFYTPTIPYIPSYLAFREIGPLCELISSQVQSHPNLKPDVIMVDGNGQWHDRRAGIACFVGVKTGIPTIGVGKTFYSLDGSLEKDQVSTCVQNSVETWYKHHVYSNKENGSDCNGGGLIVDTTPITFATETSNVHPSNDTSKNTPKNSAIQDMLSELHTIANGLAVPMQYNGEILAYALVGHGGNIGRAAHKKKSATDGCSENQSLASLSASLNQINNNNKGSGTKKQIYISVGHNISLLDAAALCAHVSVARIPEPIREADLYGRQLLREKKS